MCILLHLLQIFEFFVQCTNYRFLFSCNVQQRTISFVGVPQLYSETWLVTLLNFRDNSFKFRLMYLFCLSHVFNFFGNEYFFRLRSLETCTFSIRSRARRSKRAPSVSQSNALNCCRGLAMSMCTRCLLLKRVARFVTFSLVNYLSILLWWLEGYSTRFNFIHSFSIWEHQVFWQLC